MRASDDALRMHSVPHHQKIAGNTDRRQSLSRVRSLLLARTNSDSDGGCNYGKYASLVSRRRWPWPRKNTDVVGAAGRSAGTSMAGSCTQRSIAAPSARRQPTVSPITSWAYHARIRPAAHARVDCASEAKRTVASAIPSPPNEGLSRVWCE